MLLNESLYQRMNTGFSRTGSRETPQRPKAGKPSEISSPPPRPLMEMIAKNSLPKPLPMPLPSLQKSLRSKSPASACLSHGSRPEAVAKLPASFREKASEADKLRLVELNKTRR